MDPARVVLFSSALSGWDAARLVRAAVVLGLPGVEWGAGPDQAITDRRSGATARALCAEAGLEICRLSAQDPEATLAAPRKPAGYVRLALELGAPHVRVFAQTHAGGPLAREQAKARVGVDHLVELAAPAGLGILLETSPTTLAPSPGLAMALVEHRSARHVGVLYDPGNMAIEGSVAPRLALAQLGPYLRHVHVKNIAWSRRSGVWRWRHAPLAAGVLDWPDIFAAIAASGYVGRFSIDHLGGRPSLPLLRAECGALRSLVERASA